MDWDDLRKSREKAITTMNASVEGIEPCGIPYWICLVVAVPVSVGWIAFECVRATAMLITIWLSLLLNAVLTPFRVLWFWLDISVIAFWYFRLVAKKMSGEKI